jgi:anaerobic selenocysteine-containing dehydrogenase
MARYASAVDGGREQHLQMCRICTNGCPIVVDVEDSRAVRVRGDVDNPVYRGYLCPKGRALPDLHNDPDRLLHPLRRGRDGSFERISLDDAVADIAARLRELIDDHGPRCVVGYAATAVQAHVEMYSALGAFLTAIGSPWPPLSASTIDQAGKPVAAALHGRWMAPLQRFDEPEVGLLVGINPLVSHIGFPSTSPLTWLRERKAAGMKLLVVDPRRTETAHHADIHLQPRPGQDVAVLACLLYVILAEGLHDEAFVTAHTTGVDALREAVAAYTPEAVARRADVDAGTLVDMARTFATARRGFAGAGTGANMSGHATLVEYLILCLETVCGHYLRAGEVVRNAPALMRRREYRAQAVAPDAAGPPAPALRVPGRAEGPAETQLTDVVDEMLLEGEGKIRALVCIGGNPAAAWPDEARTLEALRSLDLLLVVDPVMTSTAKLADYVVAPKLTLETPAATNLQDFYPDVACTGYVDSHAQYVTPAVDPPPGAEVIEEWDLLMRIAHAMGQPMRLGRFELDPDASPTTDDVLAALLRNARVPLDVVKAAPHGACFVDETITVEPAEPGWQGRLDIGNAAMMADLLAFLDAPEPHDADRRYRLISRRMPHVQNSMLRTYSGTRAPYNPAYLHPDDMAELGVAAGDLVEIASSVSSITGIAEADGSLRRGVVSMSHGYGDLPGDQRADPSLGSNTARLVDVDDHHDRHSGQPRMSDLPVRVRRVEATVH